MAGENADADARPEEREATPPELKAAEKPKAAEKKAPEKAAEKKADDNEPGTPSASAAPSEKNSTTSPARTKSDSDAVPTRAGRPPLGDAEIARTIDRIGFSCGRVVSSEAVASGQGIYKINCSSGESYQGTNKQGHLFFRPWTGKLERD